MKNLDLENSHLLDESFHGFDSQNVINKSNEEFKKWMFSNPKGTADLVSRGVISPDRFLEIMADGKSTTPIS